MLGGAAIGICSYALASWESVILSPYVYVGMALASLAVAVQVRDVTGRVECLLVKEGLESAGTCGGMAIYTALAQPRSLATLSFGTPSLIHVAVGLAFIGLLSILPLHLGFFDSNGRAYLPGVLAFVCLIIVLELTVFIGVPALLPSIIPSWF